MTHSTPGSFRLSGIFFSCYKQPIVFCYLAMTKEQVTKAAQALGRLGGVAGTGQSKRRSRAHYQRAGKASGQARAKKPLATDTIGPNVSSANYSSD